MTSKARTGFRWGKTKTEESKDFVAFESDDGMSLDNLTPPILQGEPEDILERLSLAQRVVNAIMSPTKKSKDSSSLSVPSESRSSRGSSHPKTESNLPLEDSISQTLDDDLMFHRSVVPAVSGSLSHLDLVGMKTPPTTKSIIDRQHMSQPTPRITVTPSSSGRRRRRAVPSGSAHNRASKSPTRGAKRTNSFGNSGRSSKHATSPRRTEDKTRKTKKSSRQRSRQLDRTELQDILHNLQVTTTVLPYENGSESPRPSRRIRRMTETTNLESPRSGQQSGARASKLSSRGHEGREKSKRKERERGRSHSPGKSRRSTNSSRHSPRRDTKTSPRTNGGEKVSLVPNALAASQALSKERSSRSTKSKMKSRRSPSPSKTSSSNRRNKSGTHVKTEEVEGTPNPSLQSSMDRHGHNHSNLTRCHNESTHSTSIEHNPSTSNAVSAGKSQDMLSCADKTNHLQPRALDLLMNNTSPAEVKKSASRATNSLCSTPAMTEKISPRRNRRKRVAKSISTDKLERRQLNNCPGETTQPADKLSGNEHHLNSSRELRLVTEKKSGSLDDFVMLEKRTRRSRRSQSVASPLEMMKRREKEAAGIATSPVSPLQIRRVANIPVSSPQGREKCLVNKLDPLQSTIESDPNRKRMKSPGRSVRATSPRRRKEASVLSKQRQQGGQQSSESIDSIVVESGRTTPSNSHTRERTTVSVAAQLLIPQNHIGETCLLVKFREVKT